MFTKNEIKEFTVKLGRRWFFPNFSNKVTWYVVTIGAGIIVTPLPLKIIFYNWLVDTFNLNAGEHFRLSEIGSNSTDYWVGFSLIFLSLGHNLFSNWISLQEENNFRTKHDQVIDVDRKLFKEFLEVFPSGSNSAYLLKNHDFGNTFNMDSFSEIEKFVNEWNCAEKEFITPEFEKPRKELWEKCNQFCWLIAMKSGPTRTGHGQSVVSDTHKGDWEWPDWVKKDVKEVNDIATVVFQLHQDFIKELRQKLKC